MKNRKRMIILILLLVIGFASVSTTLVINGVIGISNNKNDFSIIFTNAKLDGVKRKDFIDSETKQTINYETNKLTTINQTTTLEYDVTNTSRVYDANVSITCNIVDDAGNETTSEYISMEYTPESMVVRAGETKSGSITAKLIKVSTEDKSIKVKCTLNATATERDSLGEEYKEPGTYELINDMDSDGIADVGDEIKVGTESFYVISNNGSELNALAKYNLKVGNIYSADGNTLESTISPSEEGYGRQDAQMRGRVNGEKTYGTVAFSNSNGWPYKNNDTIDIKSYDGPVKTALYGESGYENYIKTTIPNATARLVTKGEIETLINDGNEFSSYELKDKADAKGYSWIYSTTYWTQSAYSGYGSFVWEVFSIGSINYAGAWYNYEKTDGVRPVITIPLS